MATLGYTTNAATSDNGTSLMRSNFYTMPERGKLVTIHLRSSATVATARIPAIYTGDSTTGTLLNYGAANSAINTVQWDSYTPQLSLNIFERNTILRLATNIAGNTAAVYYDTDAAYEPSWLSVAYVTPPGSPYTFADTGFGATRRWGIYITYNALIEQVTTQPYGALLNATISTIPNGNATTRGFVYDTASHVDPGVAAPASSGYSGSISENGSFGTGTYSLAPTLAKNTLYYCRSYTYDGVEYSYGNEISFVSCSDLAWFRA